MSEESPRVYQSGETVPSDGVYEVVGAEPQPAGSQTEQRSRPLQTGELFPNYEGRAVSWRLKVDESRPSSLSSQEARTSR